MNTNLTAVYEELQACKSALGRIEAQLLPTFDISNRIKAAVCTEFKISVLDIMRQGRQERFVWPRQVAMYLERELTNKSLMELGEQYHKNHVTIMHAAKRVRARMDTNPKTKLQIEAIREIITNERPPRANS